MNLPALILLFGFIASTAFAHEVDVNVGKRLFPAEMRWQLLEREANTTHRFLIPDQLPEISRLPADRQSRLQKAIREHDLSARFVRNALRITRGAVRGGKLHSKPEYQSTLSEVVVGVDRGLVAGGNPLHAHEPVLKALPAYTRIDVLTPEKFVPEVEKALRRLALHDRARIISNPNPPEAKGATRWVRDTFLLSADREQQTVFHSLGYQPRRDVFVDDLHYLEFLRTSKRKVVTAPLFYRAGNFLLGVGTKRTLFVGADELAGNKEVFKNTVAYAPPTDAVLEVFAAITGADEIQILPNTRRLFHVDMYLTFLEDGVVALLEPLNPEALAAEDREVIQHARSILTGKGFRIVSIPTVAERINKFQSSTNVVPFRHRDSGMRMALVPDFPDLMVSYRGQSSSLNAMVGSAFRAAGVTPLFVEDRFFPDEGNTHCAVVALQ